jgi:Protein of unknown function (DUF4244)
MLLVTKRIGRVVDRVRMPGAHDRGMTTAEYAVGTVAAVALATV